MGKKPRPGMRAHPSARSGDSVASGYSTKSGMSSTGGNNKSRRASTRPSMHRTNSNASGMSGDNMTIDRNSRRAKLKKSGSLASIGSAISEGLVKAATAKKEKVRPGMRTAPMGASNASGMGSTTHSGGGLVSTKRVKSRVVRQNSGLVRQGSGLQRQGSGLKRQGSGLRRQGSGLSSGGGSTHSYRKAPPPPAAAAKKKDEMAPAINAPTRQTTMRRQNSGGGLGGTTTHSTMLKRQNSGLGGGTRHSIHRQNSSFSDDAQPEERPQTAEEIRQGLMTERVTKGFLFKKTRSIRWYSADIDKVDKGEYEGRENDDDSSSGEYEDDESLDDDDPANQQQEIWWKRLLRGLLLLEKKGEEVTPIKRWVRALTWLTFLCDFTAALVSLIQFDTVQQCCEKDILNMGGIDIDWGTIITWAVILYLVLILLEVYPVIRRGFPFNIVNPLIGFLITFALFFDDSYTEAIIMWGIETCAVLCEFAMYRVKIRQVNLRQEEIKKLMPKTTAQKNPTQDEDHYLRDLHKARRRYYVLKQEQRMDRQLLQYLHGAVYMNIIMASIVLVLILVIARNGGLCISQFDYPNPFNPNQLGRCYLCNATDVECQVCLPDENIYQCYFPYS